MSEPLTVTPPAKEETKDAEILKQAKHRYKYASEYHSHNRKNFKNDIDFYSGDTQWDSRVRLERETEGRPCITMNVFPSYVRQVVNDFRENKVTIKVRAVDNYADVETAEVMQGLIRHIESNSNADIAYENAFFYEVCGGFGFYRLVTEYVEGSFDQEIFIKPVNDSLTVTQDPDGIMLDGSDWNWCFVEDVVDKKDFERQYPDAGSWQPEEVDSDWIHEDKCRVAEYFYKSMVDDKVLLLESGASMYESVYQKNLEKYPDNAPAIIDSRDSKRPIVKWCKLTGNKVLEKGEWAGKYIPIIPAYGDLLQRKGKRETISLIRFAKDAQMILNYYKSTRIELEALQPKAPFVAAEGQLEGYQNEWANANRIPYSVLTYKPTTIDGVVVPPPQRQGFASPPASVIQGGAEAQQDIMNIIGIHEASLGQKSNETSGRAILARQKEGDVSTFHFADNFTRSMRHCGRQLVDLIPKIYDRPNRIIRIIGQDDTESMVALNAPNKVMEKGKEVEKIYRLDIGQYDVVCSAGASYTTQRQEMADALVQLGSSNPMITQTAGDLVVKALDFPDSEVIAERLKKVINLQFPNIIEQDEGEDGQPQLPPEVMQQMQQMDQQIQEMGQALQQAQSQLEDKQFDQQIKAQELAIKDRDSQVKAMQIQADIASKQTVQPDNTNDELSDADAEKINHEAEMKVLLNNQAQEHKKELMILQAKLDKMKDAGSMEEIGEDGVAKPNAMACHMDKQNQAIEGLQAAIAALITQINAPKVIMKDANGRPIGIAPVNQDKTIVVAE